jgi:hypothetical protein
MALMFWTLFFFILFNKNLPLFAGGKPSDLDGRRLRATRAQTSPENIS